MRDVNLRGVSISAGDLHAAAAMAEARLADPGQEAERVVSVRAFLTAAFAAERALHAHSRCVLVNHCGTHGSNNLSEATAELFQAFAQYADAIRHLVAQDAGVVAY
jgi:hypothetical protein